MCDLPFQICDGTMTLLPDTRMTGSLLDTAAVVDLLPKLHQKVNTAGAYTVHLHKDAPVPVLKSRLRLRIPAQD
jgi:hypothetical protein